MQLIRKVVTVRKHLKNLKRCLYFHMILYRFVSFRMICASKVMLQCRSPKRKDAARPGCGAAEVAGGCQPGAALFHFV